MARKSEKITFGFKKVKNLLESPEVIQKQLGDSPETIFELESHFEKSMKFAIFGNFRLRQRTETISKWATEEHSPRLAKARKMFFDFTKMSKTFLRAPK